MSNRLSVADATVRDLGQQLQECSKLLTSREAELDLARVQLVNMDADLEAIRNQVADLEKKMEDAKLASYNLGFDKAKGAYIKQVEEIRDEVVQQGWDLCLAEMKVEQSSHLWKVQPILAIAKEASQRMNAVVGAEAQPVQDPSVNDGAPSLLVEAGATLTSEKNAKESRGEKTAEANRED